MSSSSFVLGGHLLFENEDEDEDDKPSHKLGSIPSVPNHDFGRECFGLPRPDQAHQEIGTVTRRLGFGVAPRFEFRMS
jgi:hypothetical protein